MLIIPHYKQVQISYYTSMPAGGTLEASGKPVTGEANFYNANITTATYNPTPQMKHIYSDRIKTICSHHNYMRISVNHNFLGCEQPAGLDVNQSLDAQLC